MSYSGGAAGVLDDVHYVRGPSDPDQRGTLAATSLLDGSSPETARWQAPPRPTDGTSVRSCGSIDLFAHDGRLWFLDERCQPDDRPSLTVLASVDPAVGDYRALPVVAVPPAGPVGWWAQGSPAVVGEASTGHLHDGRLFTVDVDGRLVAVDLTTAEVTEVGLLSALARGAGDVSVAWSEARMAVLVVDAAQDSAVLETYDLGTGDLTTSVPVEDLGAMVAEDEPGVFLGLALRPLG